MSGEKILNETEIQAEAARRVQRMGISTSDQDRWRRAMLSQGRQVRSENDARKAAQRAANPEPKPRNKNHIMAPQRAGTVKAKNGPTLKKTRSSH